MNMTIQLLQSGALVGRIVDCTDSKNNGKINHIVLGMFKKTNQTFYPAIVKPEIMPLNCYTHRRSILFLNSKICIKY